MTTDGPLDADRIESLRALDDGALLLELAALFRREAPARIVELRAALSAGDVSAVAKLAHRLKGTGANIGAVHVASLAAGIELAAETGSAPPLEEIEMLERALNEAIEALPA